MDGLLVLIFVAALPIYFGPTLVARHRNHKKATDITLLNLLAGWTVIGWCAAIIWAMSRTARPVKQPRSTNERNLITAQRYAEITGLTLDVVARRIRRGQLTGRVVRGVWHVELDEIPAPLLNAFSARVPTESNRGSRQGHHS